MKFLALIRSTWVSLRWFNQRISIICSESILKCIFVMISIWPRLSGLIENTRRKSSYIYYVVLISEVAKGNESALKAKGRSLSLIPLVLHDFFSYFSTTLSPSVLLSIQEDGEDLVMQKKTYKAQQAHRRVLQRVYIVTTMYYKFSFYKMLLRPLFPSSLQDLIHTRREECCTSTTSFPVGVFIFLPSIMLGITIGCCFTDYYLIKESLKIYSCIFW